MKISRREAEMMDLVLEAFDENNQLSQEELLLLFGDDGQQATKIVGLLEQTGLIIKGEEEVYIVRTAGAIDLLQNGGVTQQYDAATNAQKIAEPPLQNTDPQQQQLQHAQTLHEKNQRILDLELRVKSLEAQTQQLQFVKGLLWLLGVLSSGLAIWVVELLLKHHK